MFAPGTGPGCPEILLICAIASLTALHLFHFHEEPLELGGMRIWIDNRRCEPIGDCPRVLARVLLNSAESLVDRQSDLVHPFAVDRHRLNAFGDKCLGDVVTARAGNLYFVSAADA